MMTPPLAARWAASRRGNCWWAQAVGQLLPWQAPILLANCLSAFAISQLTCLGAVYVSDEIVFLPQISRIFKIFDFAKQLKSLASRIPESAKSAAKTKKGHGRCPWPEKRKSHGVKGTRGLNQLVSVSTGDRRPSIAQILIA